MPVAVPDGAATAVHVEYNRLAEIRLKDAKKYARVIANFPFIQAVFISGSLSKHVMKPNSDIDFFIITKPDRLWLRS